MRFNPTQTGMTWNTSVVLWGQSTGHGHQEHLQYWELMAPHYSLVKKRYCKCGQNTLTTSSIKNNLLVRRQLIDCPRSVSTYLLLISQCRLKLWKWLSRCYSSISLKGQRLTHDSEIDWFFPINVDSKNFHRSTRMHPSSTCRIVCCLCLYNYYWGISLLVARKILIRILLNCLVQYIEQVLLPESQHGFRKGCRTIDTVFLARQLQERCQEQNSNLYMTFIDLTKAFDTVSWESLWKIMAKLGCPEIHCNGSAVQWWHSHSHCGRRWVIWTIPSHQSSQVGLHVGLNCFQYDAFCHCLQMPFMTVTLGLASDTRLMASYSIWGDYKQRQM